MKPRRVVLVIVEGPSDETALRLMLEKAFDSEAVFVQVVHGDIASDKGSRPNNIVRRVNELINQSTTSRNPFRKSDILLVIHLMDTDGTYVDQGAMTQVSTATRYVYSPTQVIVPNIEEAVSRNNRKKANMDVLASTSTIAQVPYLAVYMSCNLDHVLYNKVNSDRDDKRRDALAFRRRYGNDVEAFKLFIASSEFSVIGSKTDTWAFIREGLHSLERHTNLGISFDAVDTLRVS